MIAGIYRKLLQPSAGVLKSPLIRENLDLDDQPEGIQTGGQLACQEAVYHLREKANPLPGRNEREGAIGSTLQGLLPPSGNDEVQPVQDHSRHY
jgi:hypothetical protein